MRHSDAGERLGAPNAVPVGLELEAALAAHVLVDAHALVRHIRSRRIDDHVVLTQRPVRRLDTRRPHMSERGADELDIVAVQRVEPPQVEGGALGAERWG